jgi:hypothetical protein
MYTVAIIRAAQYTMALVCCRTSVGTVPVSHTIALQDTTVEDQKFYADLPGILQYKRRQLLFTSYVLIPQQALQLASQWHLS